MYEKELLDIGLTKNEVKIYLALLKIGKSASGRIIKETNVASGKIYETLNKLTSKGLVEIIIENNVKKFIASDPESIMLYVNEKKNKIDEQQNKIFKIVPQLQKLKDLAAPEDNVYWVKGFRGIKPIVYKALKKTKSTIKIMGVRSSKNESYNIFWKHWHKERTTQKKKAQMLFTDRNTAYWKFFKSLKHSSIKSIKELSPSAIMIIDNNSLIFTYEEGFACIHIKSAPIAKSFESFFDGLWHIGRS
tara:strand:- start:1526 stop:2266 length:741 start_codon:yes stop_codon:yes gene_type:complete